MARSRPEIGQVAPAFTAVDSAGRTLRSDSFRGKPLVLEWHNPECPFAGKHYESGNMQALQRHAIARGGAWLTVFSLPAGSMGHVEGVEAEFLFEKRRSAPTALVMDPTTRVAAAFGALTTPHVFLIDAAGRLAYQGGVDSIASTRIEDIAIAVPYLRNAIDAVATGRAPDPATSRPYGCPLKYLPGA